MTNTVASATSKLDAVLELWYPKLQEWARSGQLRKAAKQALRLDGTPRRLKRIIEALSGGDFRDLPEIVLLPASSMPGAAGAYAISTGKIYINQDWLLQASDSDAISVLTHEYGHHLDGLLNDEDTEGDEGERFEAILNHPSQIQRASSRSKTRDRYIELSVNERIVLAESMVPDWAVEVSPALDGNLLLKNASRTLSAISDGTSFITGAYRGSPVFGQIMLP